MNFFKSIGLVLFTLLFLVNCKSDNKQALLTGKWRMTFEKDKISQAMLPAEIKILKVLPAAQQAKAWAEIQQKIEENTFEFKKDQSFELILKSETIREKGTWELKSNLIVLTKPSTSSAKKMIQEEILIKTIEPKKLILQYQDKQGKTREMAWQKP